MFYISTHVENNGGLLVFYWAMPGQEIQTASGYCPNESEWMVPEVTHTSEASLLAKIESMQARLDDFQIGKKRHLDLNGASK